MLQKPRERRGSWCAVIAAYHTDHSTRTDSAPHICLRIQLLLLVLYLEHHLWGEHMSPETASVTACPDQWSP